MTRQSLETLNDLARAGYSLKVTCETCGHVAIMDPHQLRERCRIKRISPRLEAVEQRLKCSICGSRPTAWPSLAEPHG